MPRRGRVDHGAGQDGPEQHVEHIVRVHVGVDAARRRGAQDVLELRPHRDAQVRLGRAGAFDLILAEGLWAEWRASGVDVLSLVLSATDTPSLRRVLDAKGGSYGELADPVDVAEQALEHLADGPTWIWGKNPTGSSPLGALSRRDAVLAMSRGAAATATAEHNGGR